MDLKMAVRSLFPAAPTSRINLNFLDDLAEYDHTKPYHFSGPLSKELEPSRTNIQYRMLHDIPVSDLRREERKLLISKHGFQFIQVPEDVIKLDIRGSENQKQEYIESITILIKQLLGASFALCYDCRFRSSTSSKPTDRNITVGTAEHPDTPAEAAHIGYLTPIGAARRTKRHLTNEEAEKYLNRDWRMRVVKQVPTSSPVPTTLTRQIPPQFQPDDLVAVDRVLSEYVGEVYMLKPRKHYRWYRIDHQKPNEATIFMSYDSDPGNGAPYCPHTSAKNPTLPNSVYTRESIELRILLFSPTSDVSA
ncbi:uncharacterized protein PGRI_023020 [Penicillium griseofulvum]|uniref:Uncharacterized protein n=1 Tax=Penicillium patulum TaxID=5078 RepID=A0A135LHI9_PENPA|nr:uncharacterized protein PGRI_023020 [Penicillium griseofulvum]KXG48432.1 hypothetical protein PGRI_023020 [Penicillium griseofulvum]